jgi:two-component system nitrogen regulation response regulator GlnG
VLQRALAAPQPSVPASVTAVDGFVGRTPQMQEAFNRIALAAAADACVLLQGESGTGKELAARAIHRHSSRASGPLVIINVASLSETLAESELFGHVRGAFTGADQPREGLLVRADGGTLFLDEIADIPVPVQIKLLRAFEQREVIPVGANEPRRADFRIISATHQSLLQRVQEGQFRHDLYFRIASFCINLPPLRDRREDIVPLCIHFLSELPGSQGALCRLSREAELELTRRPWHGNVRELRNAMQHAAILARGSLIMPEHLPPSAPASVVPGQDRGTSLDAQIQSLLAEWAAARLATGDHGDQLYEQLLALVEPPVLKTVVESQAGQLVSSARLLGLHRTTLRKKLDQHQPHRDERA